VINAFNFASKLIGPILLPSTNDTNGLMGTAMGWGKTFHPG
jgi:hypothetical protein